MCRESKFWFHNGRRGAVRQQTHDKPILNWILNFWVQDQYYLGSPWVLRSQTVLILMRILVPRRRPRPPTTTSILSPQIDRIRSRLVSPALSSASTTFLGYFSVRRQFLISSDLIRASVTGFSADYRNTLTRRPVLWGGPQKAGTLSESYGSLDP